MARKSLVGCSHVVWAQKLPRAVFSSKEWDYGSFFGATSMPIFHEKMVEATINACKKCDHVFLFPFRSLAFNTINYWMVDNLKLDDSEFYSKKMDHSLYLKSLDNPNKWYIDYDLLKNESVVETQNEFFTKWLSYYKKFPQVKFIFWCHFGAWWGKEGEGDPAKHVYKHHISYPELRELFPNSVDLEDFAKSYGGKLFGDSEWHPSRECIKSLVKYLEEHYS